MTGKFLLDENLSRHLCSDLELDFPGTRHISALNLAARSDEEIWHYARQHGFTIMTKDADFDHLSFLRGAPPKVVWLQCGNRSTPEIRHMLLANRARLLRFHEQPEDALCIITAQS